MKPGRQPWIYVLTKLLEAHRKRAIERERERELWMPRVIERGRKIEHYRKWVLSKRVIV